MPAIPRISETEWAMLAHFVERRRLSDAELRDLQRILQRKGARP